MAEFVGILGVLSQADGTIQAKIELVFDDATGKFVSITITNNSDQYADITVFSPRQYSYRVNPYIVRSFNLPANARTTYSFRVGHIVSGTQWSFMLNGI